MPIKHHLPVNIMQQYGIAIHQANQVDKYKGTKNKQNVYGLLPGRYPHTVKKTKPYIHSYRQKERYKRVVEKGFFKIAGACGKKCPRHTTARTRYVKEIPKRTMVKQQKDTHLLYLQRN